MKIMYQPTRISRERMALLNQCNAISDEYRADGLLLTLRQLYYQLVSRDLLPNSQKEYKRLSDVVNTGRLAGVIDWDAIEDRSRNLDQSAHWENPGEIIQACASQYRLDRWETQDIYPEVWIEKDALSGVFERVCGPFDVPLFACRGYTSQSEMWAAGQRFVDRIEAGKKVIIFHFGDHDPSGIDMTRDILERLQMFVSHHVGAEPARSCFEVRRLALNMDQVRRYQPPENPAKATDTRFEGYRATYGDSSWELDALNPKTLVGLVRGSLESVCDPAAWEAMLQREAEGKEQLRAAAELMSGGAA